MAAPALLLPPAPPAPVDARSLARLDRADLERCFAALPAPVRAELHGATRGHLLGVLGVDRLPRRLRSGLYAVLRTPLNVWRGKRFEGENGVNLWGVGEGQLRFAAFRVREAAALDGSGPCLRLDYDVDANALPLRAIVGELRALGPGLLLGRMHYQAGSARSCLLWFTLES